MDPEGCLRRGSGGTGGEGVGGVEAGGVQGEHQPREGGVQVRRQEHRARIVAGRRE